MQRVILVTILVLTVAAVAYAGWILMALDGSTMAVVLGATIPVFVAIAWSQAAALKSRGELVPASTLVIHTFVATVFFVLLAQLVAP